MNIYTAFRTSAQRYPDRIVLYQPEGSGYFSRTYGEGLADIEKVAAYLSKLPLRKGDRVALLSENRYEWWVAYFAIVSLGLVAVPLDPQLGLSDWQHFLRHSEAQVLFLTDRLAQPTESILNGVPDLKNIIHFGEDYPQIMRDDVALKAALQRPEVNEEDVASILYTAGTAGTPRGVMLTHGNLLSNARVAAQGWAGKGLTAVSLLPAHHVYGLTTGLAGIFQGMRGIIFPVLDQEILRKSLRELRPHIILGVPVFYERLAQGIQNRLIAKLPGRIQHFIERRLNGWLGAKSSHLRLVKRLLFRPIHRGLGGRIQQMVSGGAPLEPRIIRLFNLLGLTVLEGYGLTETSPLVAANDRHNYRIGSVGRPVSGVAVKIDQPDATGAGEIWVKSPGVMRGYYRDPEATRAVIDADGWFHTGDVGRLDDDGFLYILGRKREVIVTAGGKNVYPDEVEQYFRHIPLIKEVCLFGVEKQNHGPGEVVHMQVVPDPEEAKRRGISDVETAIKAEIVRRPDRLATYLPAHKRPTSIGFSRDAFPRTTTLKIKKLEVKAAYLADLAAAPSEVTSKAEDAAPFQSAVGSTVLEVVKALLPAGTPIRPASFLSLDLGLDSLSTIELWTNLERAFGLRIPEPDRFELKQVEPIIAYLEKNSLDHLRPPGRLGSDWSRILDDRPEETRRIVENALRAPARTRMIMLGMFRKLFKYICRLRVEGLENLPPQGPYILASNHATILDYFFITGLMPSLVQKNLVVIARDDYFADKSFSKRLIRRFGQAPLLDIFKMSQFVLSISAQVLREGKILLVFPETIRTFDGDLLPFKNGVGLLANETRCPLVPVYIRGGFDFFPRGSIIPRHRGDVTVKIGTALPPTPASDPAEELAAAQQLTERLRQSLIAMSRP